MQEPENVERAYEDALSTSLGMVSGPERDLVLEILRIVKGQLKEAKRTLKMVVDGRFDELRSIKENRNAAIRVLICHEMIARSLQQEQR
jgi:hypothetical protein